MSALPNFNTLWNYDKPEETELKFRELIPVAEESGDKNYYAELLTQLARTQSLQRKFDAAHELLDRVEKMLSANDLPVAEIRYLLERGRTYNEERQKEKAIALFKEAYEKATKIKEDYYAIDAAHMVGIAERPSEQLFWNLKTMELIEASADTRAKGWLGPLYNNLGWAYHDVKDYSRAMELFEKSLAWRIEHKHKKGILIAKWCIGRTFRSLNKIDEALKIQYELLSEGGDGFVHEELGECLLLKGKKEEAKEYFKQAYEMLSKDEWFKANESNRLERLNQLGNF